MTVTAEQRLHVVKRAMSLIGQPYVYGAEGKHGDDCSGSVMYAWEGLHHFPVHRAADMVHAKGVRSVVAGRGAVKMDEHGKTAQVSGHGPLHFPRHWLLYGDVVWYYDFRFPPHVAVFVGDQEHNGRKVSNAVVNATDSQHGIELIEMDEYTPRVGFGYIEH